MICLDVSEGPRISGMNKSSVAVEADEVCAAVLILAISEVTIATKRLHGNLRVWVALVLATWEIKSSRFSHREQL